MIVCTLYSPGEFYCQIANSNGKFLQLLFFSVVSLLSDFIIVSSEFTAPSLISEFCPYISDFVLNSFSELRALNSLNKSLFEYCQKTPPNVFKPEKGEPCCALFSGK